MKGTRIAIAALLGAVIAGPGAGQASDLSEETVSVLAGTCANCHGTDGRSPGDIPSIAGMPERVLAAQLAAFRAGEVTGATVMTRIARGYSEEQLDALARYFSEQAE